LFEFGANRTGNVLERSMREILAYRNEEKHTSWYSRTWCEPAPGFSGHQRPVRRRIGAVGSPRQTLRWIYATIAARNSS